jgi:hypothetical protein
MRTILYGLWVLGGIGAAASSVSGCSSSCSDTGSCGTYAPPTGGMGNAGSSGTGHGGAGGAHGGGSSSGESGTSGASGTSGTTGAGDSGEAGTAGAAGTAPCDGKCSGTTSVCLAATNACVECTDSSQCAAPKPACDTASNACVECTAAADCKDITKPFCDTTAGQCVACLKQADCTTATASACNAGACAACAKDADCSNIAGKGVCDAGTCVQCTGNKFTACGNNAGTPLVCDSLKRTCTANKQHSVGLCQTCVTDAQCNAGEMCVLDKFSSPSKDVGYFCHWKQGDTTDGAPADCTAGGRPYIGIQKNATSIDGTASDICTLAVSTCTALNQFRAKDCTVASAPSDAVCGVSPPNDAKCMQFGSTTYRCTVTCGSDDDCPSPFPCDPGVSPRVCNFTSAMPP